MTDFATNLNMSSGLQRQAGNLASYWEQMLANLDKKADGQNNSVTSNFADRALHEVNQRQMASAGNLQLGAAHEFKQDIAIEPLSAYETGEYAGFPDAPITYLPQTDVPLTEAEVRQAMDNVNFAAVWA